MQVAKDKIVEHVRANLGRDRAADAQRELPDQVDTERDAGALARFGINPSDLPSALGGVTRKLGF